MRKNIQLSLLLVASFFFITNITYSAGFNSVHTPDGVHVIAVGNSGLIFKSSDSGDSWASYTISSVNFKSVFSFNNYVWIAGDNGKIYKTLATNSSVNPYDVGFSGSVNSIYFHDENNGVLCGDGGMIFKTTNGGVNWSLSNSGISTVKLNSIYFKDAQNGIVVGDNGKVFLTTNGGSSWINEILPTTKNLLKTKYFNNGITIVGAEGALFTKSGSGAWVNINSRVTADIGGVTGSDINDVHICGGGGFIRNNKNGNTKFYNFEINPMLANLVDIFYYNLNLGFAVSSLNNAVIRTTNGGDVWTLTAGAVASYSWQLKLTATSSFGNDLCMHPTDRNSMFVAYGSRVYVSRDRGESWTQIATMTGSGITNGKSHSFYVSPLDTNIWMSAISGVNPFGKVIRSTDYGQTWTIIQQGNFTVYGQPLEMDQNNPGTFYFAPAGGGFWKSTDNGASFNQISTVPFNTLCDIIVMWDSSNVLFAGDSSPNRIFKSTDGGINWTLVMTSTGAEIPSMANSVFDRSIAFATAFSSPIYKTSNYGSNWESVFSSPGSAWGSGICLEDPTVYLFATFSGSIGYLTTNSGANFFSTSVTGGGANSGIIVPERGYIIAQQQSSLYKFNVFYNVSTSVNENIISTAVPSCYELYQNYPNPFNPSTNIKFDLPNAGIISLKVYNQLGREVKTLSEGFRNTGTYEINFDASELSSGIYFYKLTTEISSITKKMLLVK